MSDQATAPSSALRPSQATAAELVAGGAHIAIPAKQPLGELTQAPIAENQHISSGIRMHGIHAGNFIRQKNGSLIPIDIYFEGLPACPS